VLRLPLQLRRNSGRCRKWHSGASQSTRRLAASVNGPLLEELAERAKGSAKCVEYFREGEARDFPAKQCLCFCFCSGAPLFDEEEYWCHWRRCKDSNKELLASLREDERAEKLHQIAIDDYEKQRMSMPVRAADIDFPRCCVAPDLPSRRA